MCRHEVFPDRQPFAERTLNRRLDNLFSNRTALGLCHETTHSADLRSLGTGTTSTRINQHIDRVETLLVLDQSFHQCLFDFSSSQSPGVNDNVVLFCIGHQPAFVCPVNLLERSLAPFQNLILLFRHRHIVYAYGKAGPGGHLKTKVFDIIQEFNSNIGAELTGTPVYQCYQFILGKGIIHKSQLIGQNFVKNNPSGIGLDELALIPEFNRVVNIEFVKVKSRTDGRKVIKIALRITTTRLQLGHVINPNNNILGRHHQRPTMGRRQNIM